MTKAHARRTFLRYLAASPLFAAAAFEPLQRVLAADRDVTEERESGEIIASVEDAISVFDFHAVAREKLPPAHYGYLMTGSDRNETRDANRTGFKHYQLRMRRLIDVRNTDTSVDLLGRRWDAPIALAPTGSQKAFHPDGELAVARAARETNTVQIVSTVATSSVEDVNRELGQPAWFQLYASEDWNITQTLVKRAEQAGCPVVTLTVDQQGENNREMSRRYARKDTRDCNVCHDRSGPRFARKPMMAGLDYTNLGSTHGPQMDWDFARRLRDSTKMKLFIKGIVTHEDAKLCVEHGMDGIIVSNHGGRSEASARGTIECLPEITEAVNRRIPVLIDGGFRRGTDVFKALALGADAICIGRPYLWGLAAFGAEGVRAVIEMMRAEFYIVMRQAGATSIDKISPNHILRVG